MLSADDGATMAELKIGDNVNHARRLEGRIYIGASTETCIVK